jgi:initiation factor 1A
MGRIGGTMKKRDRIREGDTLIITPWRFQDTKGDIIYLTSDCRRTCCEIATIFNREPFFR